MRLLERRHGDGVRLDGSSPSPPMRDQPSTQSPKPQGGRGYRLSPERQAIIDVIRQNPDGMSPVEVARALGKEPNPIQTNMSRMVKAEMLVRVGHSLYRLPGQSAPVNDLLNSAQNAVEDGEEVESP